MSRDDLHVGSVTNRLPSPPINYPPFFMNGVRYRAQDLRSGSGSTFIIEKYGGWLEGRPPSDGHFWNREPIHLAEPIAGPVERVDYGEQHKQRYSAHCCNCGRFSKKYQKAKEPAMWGWAARHRCQITNVVGDRNYKKPRRPDGRPF